MKKMLFSLILGTLVFLTSCAQNLPASSSRPQKEPVEQTSSTSPRVQTSSFHAVHRYDGTSFGSGNEKGFYFVNTVGYADGSTNLMYLDYATMQKIYLCSQPNCTHQTETCASYIPPNGGGAVPVVIGEKLVLVSLGNSYFQQDLGNAALPKIEIMSLDGSNRKSVATFEANQTIEKPFLTDDEHLYFRLTTINADNTSASVMQLSTKTGKLLEVAPLNPKRNERIWGSTEDQIILYRYKDELAEDVFPENLDYEIALMDGNTLETTSVYHWTDGKKEPALFSDSLVSFDEETRRINVLNLHTQQNQQSPELSLPEKMQNTNIVFYELKDNHLIYSVRIWKQDGTGIERCDFFTLNLSEQTIQPFSLQYSFQDELSLVSIVAIPNPNTYLVIKGETMLQTQQVGEDGVSYSLPAPVRDYALIQKDDFWNSRDIYKMFSLD